MPELPDIAVYIDALEARIAGRTLERARALTPFILRTASPPLCALEQRKVARVRRLGKRVVLEFEGALFVVIHLMVAGRLRWLARGAKPPGRIAQASFEFADGTLVVTEAGTKRRASIHVVEGDASLKAFDAGGLDIAAIGLDAFRDRILAENHTLKRTLTDPSILSGIGNAYSDEILHRARLSPVALTRKLSEGEVLRLFEATRSTLAEWTARLRAEAGERFPDKVTAFRPDMAVHGRYGLPCPDCGSPVQRIVYADNETDYCARCQTDGKVLADRALSRLLKASWPRSIDELG